MFVNITVYKSVQRSGSAQTHWESLQTLTGFYGMGWGRVVRGGDESTEGRVNAYASRHLNLWIHPELVIGHFFKTQPNPTQNFWTQPKPTHKSSHDPTQPIIETWYGILDYTENFIQQLLHVTDKFTVEDLPYIQLVDSTFYMPTVNESYYSAAVLINRQ